MITLEQIFSLPCTHKRWTEVLVEDNWFPELNFDLDDEFWAEVDKANRLSVHELVYKDVDGYRYAAMYLIKFDGEPLLAIQQAGRSGRDHFERWRVASDEQYSKVLQHLNSLKPLDSRFEDEPTPLDKPFFEEQFLHFYGDYWGDQFGIPAQPRVKMELLPCAELGWKEQANGQNLYLVISRNPDVMLGQFIRRGVCVMEFVKAISREELDEINPRINVVSDSAQKPWQAYLYQKAENWPDDANVLSV